MCSSRRNRFLEHDSQDVEVVAARDRERVAAARAEAEPRARRSARDLAANPAGLAGGPEVHLELRRRILGAGHGGLPCELEEVGLHGGKLTDGDAHDLETARAAVGYGLAREAADLDCQAHLVYQQILGSCSPVSRSTMRRPPMRLLRRTVPRGSAKTSPMAAALRPSGCALSRASASPPAPRATITRHLPSFAT